MQVWKGLCRGTREIAIRKLEITFPRSTQQLVDAVTGLCRVIRSPHVVQVCFNLLPLLSIIMRVAPGVYVMWITLVNRCTL